MRGVTNSVHLALPIIEVFSHVLENHLLNVSIFLYQGNNTTTSKPFRRRNVDEFTSTSSASCKAYELSPKKAYGPEGDNFGKHPGFVHGSSMRK